MSSHRYFVLNKPTDMLSQFVSDSPKANLLGQLDFPFPEGTHAIGRLDKNTEGVLLLTTDKRITGLLFHSEQKHMRTYLVMVKNVVSEETLAKLRTGVTIQLKAKEFYNAVPAGVEIVNDPLSYYPYVQDERTQYPHTWLLMHLTEGKYRQVRKMALTVGHRCLRLIRLSIEDMTLETLKPGEVKEFTEEEYFKRLRLPVPTV